MQVSRATSYGLTLAAAAAIAAGGAGAAAARPDRGSEGCLRARIGGQLECLGAGVACRPRYERLYVLYGLTCKPGADAVYRLRARLFIGTPTPASDR